VKNSVEESHFIIIIVNDSSLSELSNSGMDHMIDFIKTTKHICQLDSGVFQI
jgi:hypothetical protein